MTKKLLLIISFLFVAFITTHAFAQNTATANISATIVTPITIVHKADMNFGRLLPGNLQGSIVLSGNGVRTANGGVTLPEDEGTISGAVFEVTGQAGYTYATLLPSEVTLTNGSSTMIVKNFTSDGTGQLSNGAQTLHIGATLQINGDQAVGVYTSDAPLTITINYN